MDIRSLGPSDPVWPGNYGEHSWVPLLFLETGTPQDKAQAQLPPRRELTELGAGKLLCSCLGPRCITGGCLLVLLPVPKGTLGPGLGIYEGATVQGQEEGPRHGP